MSLIDSIIPKRRGRPSKAVADANAAVDRLGKDLVRLNAKRDELATRQSEAQAAFDKTKEQRRSALASDPGADITALSRAVRDAEDHAQMFADALADVESQIASVTAERDAQDLAGKREQVAGHFEGIADAVDEAAAELEKAVAGVSKAFEKLKEAIPDDYALIEIDWPDYSRAWGPARPQELATVILAESLYRLQPEMFIRDSSTFGLYRFFETGSKPTTKLYRPPWIAGATGATDRLWQSRSLNNFGILQGTDVP